MISKKIIALKKEIVEFTEQLEIRKENLKSFQLDYDNNINILEKSTSLFHENSEAFNIFKELQNQNSNDMARKETEKQILFFLKILEENKQLELENKQLELKNLQSLKNKNSNNNYLVIQNTSFNKKLVNKEILQTVDEEIKKNKSLLCLYYNLEDETKKVTYSKTLTPFDIRIYNEICTLYYFAQTPEETKDIVFSSYQIAKLYYHTTEKPNHSQIGHITKAINRLGATWVKCSAKDYIINQIAYDEHQGRKTKGNLKKLYKLGRLKNINSRLIYHTFVEDDKGNSYFKIFRTPELLGLSQETGQLTTIDRDILNIKTASNRVSEQFKKYSFISYQQN